MIYVTDTHPLVWLLSGDTRLSQPAREALTDASSIVVVPTIVLAEIQFLHSRQRINVDLPDIITLVAGTQNMSIHPFDQRTAELLPISLDIHDAIIVATALVHVQTLTEAVALVTKDQEITQSGLVNVVW